MRCVVIIAVAWSINFYSPLLSRFVTSNETSRKTKRDGWKLQARNPNLGVADAEMPTSGRQATASWATSFVSFIAGGPLHGDADDT
jgi:hypothetical protein